MFHPRPFGGSANIFAKSNKSEPKNRNDGQATSLPDPGLVGFEVPNSERSVPLRRNPVNDNRAIGHHKGNEQRRSVDESRHSNEGRYYTDRKYFSGNKPLPEPKNFGESKHFPELRTLAEPKGFDDIKLPQHVSTVSAVPPPSDNPASLTKIEIPSDADHLATTESQFEKHYLVQLMLTIDRRFRETGRSPCEVVPPKFKFVECHVPAPHQFVHGSREGGMPGMHGSASQSMFEHGDANRKSMEGVPGHRRGYFEQRVPKGKDNFRMSREAFDGADYAKRVDHHDAEAHVDDLNKRWKSYEDRGMHQVNDERPLQFEGMDQLNQHGANIPPEHESTILNVIKSQRRHDNFQVQDRFHTFDSASNPRADTLLSVHVDRPSVQHSPSGIHFKNTVINESFISTESSEHKLLQYTTVGASSAPKSPQPWNNTPDVTTWQLPPANPVKAPDIFDSPDLNVENQRLSFLERLLDKSFDSTDTVMDTATEFQKVMNLAAPQAVKSQPSKPKAQPKAQPILKSPVQPKPQPIKGPTAGQTQTPSQSAVPTTISGIPPMPVAPPMLLQMKDPEPPTINLHWQYKDFHGVVHGPFSSGQMYKWHTNNFFNPNLQMRYNEQMPWSALKDLYPNGYDAFLTSPVGYIPEVPKHLPEHSHVVPPPPIHVVEGVSMEDMIQGNESVRSSNLRWNKPEDLKVDSLLDIMEKQMRQSVPPMNTSSPVVPKPSPGWKISDNASSAFSVASDDFPSLALGAEMTAKSAKKVSTQSGTQPHQPSTMSLKAFMRHQAQSAESMRGTNPRESFARKLMGDKK
ncbi:GYF domain family protein [Babesia bovis T2Bo]|uniref:GYF domain-containing protein n=1 Tax=Babesia bovis TaxID=5865 RepID=A7AUS0_BABBO|nr:GYF domain family protein [Babesia bovis T2Bo]EDO06681.1 GYF domain family protein [Babesia bovis T2Bo]|eukprot:XP_001610249.1 hypothetical protein [Babesia bovis T2Bo]